jgi:hypothetical protein
MIICYQYWFVPKDPFTEGFDLKPYILHSRKHPDEDPETIYGIYKELMATWRVKKWK